MASIPHRNVRLIMEANDLMTTSEGPMRIELRGYDSMAIMRKVQFGIG